MVRLELQTVTCTLRYRHVQLQLQIGTLRLVMVRLELQTVTCNFTDVLFLFIQLTACFIAYLELFV